MLGEITMLQFYSIALTAGKAHKDHKHHHAHHFDHNGQPITTPPPPTPAPRINQATHPLLTAGQINPALNLNFAQQSPPPPQLVPGILPNGQQFDAQLVNGQFAGNLVSQQLLGAQQPQQQPQTPPGLQFAFPVSSQGAGPQTFAASQPRPQQLQFQPSFPQQLSQPIPLTDYSGTQPLPGSGLVHSSLVNPANVQIIDSTFANHQLYKRNNGEGTATSVDETPKSVTKREAKENNHKKRELILSGGQIIDDGLGGNYDPSLLTGLATFQNNQPVLKQQQASDEREPAEAEVMAVMNVCGGCDEEPFAKALVFGWRNVHKKLYSGAIYAPAVPQCRVF